MLSYLCLGQAARDWFETGRVIAADPLQPLSLQPSVADDSADLLIIDSAALNRETLCDYRFSQLIEVDRHCPATIQLVAETPECRNLLTFHLGTERAYRERVAPLFLSCLRQCYPTLPDSSETRYDLPLHEAIINAAIHGNLGLDSSYTDIESMQRFYQALERGLADPQLAARRVTVSAQLEQQQIHLRVTDQGAGHPAVEPGDRQDLPHGRGVLLMMSTAASVSFCNGGRTSDMAFVIEE